MSRPFDTRERAVGERGIRAALLCGLAAEAALLVSGIFL